MKLEVRVVLYARVSSYDGNSMVTWIDSLNYLGCMLRRKKIEGIKEHIV